MNKLIRFLTCISFVPQNIFSVPSLSQLATQRIFTADVWPEVKKYFTDSKLFNAINMASVIKSEGLTLKGLDLSGMDLSNFNFKNCKFIDVNLSDTTLIDTIFDGAIFQRVKLNGVILHKDLKMDKNFNYTSTSPYSLIDSYLSLRKNKPECAEALNRILGPLCIKWPSQTSLKGFNLSKINLSNADLTNCNLQEADLTGANLTNALLNRANLQRIKMQNANLCGAQLANAKLNGAVLTGVNLTNANIDNALLQGASLSDEVILPNYQNPNQLFGLWACLEDNLEKIQFLPHELGLRDKDYPDLTPTPPEYEKLKKQEYKPLYQKLINANFNIFKGVPQTTMARVDWKKVDFSNINLENAQLKEIDFTGVNLIKVNFKNANLIGANFTDANLSDANLQSANLDNANFTNTNLKNTDLRYTKLRNATFINTKFDQTNFYDSNLEYAKDGANIIKNNKDKMILSIGETDFGYY